MTDVQLTEEIQLIMEVPLAESSSFMEDVWKNASKRIVAAADTIRPREADFSPFNTSKI